MPAAHIPKYCRLLTERKSSLRPHSHGGLKEYLSSLKSKRCLLKLNVGIVFEPKSRVGTLVHHSSCSANHLHFLFLPDSTTIIFLQQPSFKLGTYSSLARKSRLEGSLWRNEMERRTLAPLPQFLRREQDFSVLWP